MKPCALCGSTDMGKPCPKSADGFHSHAGGGGAKCPNSRCRQGWVAYEPNESGGAPPIACRHEDCPHGGGAK